MTWRPGPAPQPMTLKYASPEQLWALPITTAADIYSLGVLIYQLLTGHDPYPMDSGLLAMHRSICEQHPVKPSVAVGRSVEVRVSEDHSQRRTPESVSRKRDTTPGRLQGALAGDLDGILLKALRKRPENRYRSVEQLADDLRRHLEGLPVSACEGSFRYLAGKFARRHAWGLAAAAAMLLVLIGSGFAMTVLWRRAAEEESRTEQARAESAERREVRSAGRRRASLLVQDPMELSAREDGQGAASRCPRHGLARRPGVSACGHAFAVAERTLRERPTADEGKSTQLWGFNANARLASTKAPSSSSIRSRTTRSSQFFRLFSR